jgi:membrane associated rhomboid family serine protease
VIVPIPPRFHLFDILDLYPWTLALTFLNVFFYFTVFNDPGSSLDQLVNKTEEKSEITSEFIQKAGHYYIEWDHKSKRARRELEIQAIGSQAIRDVDFISALNTWNSKVDPVGFPQWREEFDQVFRHQENKPISIFGLSQVDNKPLTWITYQFSHQGFFHLFSNMLLMIFFAAVVERLVGGFLMGVIYLVGGLMGAFFFLHMESSGLIPMVGASASVTALMGFLASGSLKKNIEYFFFLAPAQGFFGRVYLSPLWIISLFLISDLSEMLSDPPGWGGGIAHSAHLGGAFAGLVLGLAFKYGVSREDSLKTKAQG